MKKLADILGEIVYEIDGDPEQGIEQIHVDSRKAGKEDLFVAIKGTQVDGHKFIDVVKAKVIVCEQLPPNRKPNVTYVKVANTREAWAWLMAAWYEYPARKLKIIGITGTNGKTSVAMILHALFQELGEPTGLISTVEYRIGEEVFPSTHTTPDPAQLHALFARMVEAGCAYCFMEVSSHALAQGRTTSIPFEIAVFTNITHDHLDYHGSFSAYIQAKKLLFDGLSTQAVALVNWDDKNGKIMVQNTAAQVKTFSLRRLSDYRARTKENTLEGLLLDIEGQEVWFRILGAFNAYNLLTAYAVAVELELEEPAEVLKALSVIEGVPGRIQRISVPGNSVIAIVDYAHTPDALAKVLQTLQEMNREDRNVISVVGCGGDRDKAKRPLMGKIAAEHSTQVIFTSDNPRSEDPEAIIQEMYEGVPLHVRRRILRIVNREEAIRTALHLAAPGDIVLVAGKGHETYQEIQGVKYPFDDREKLKTLMTELNN